MIKRVLPAAAVLALAACSAAGTTARTAATETAASLAAAPSSAPATAATPDCATQAQTWANNGPLGNFVNDISTFATAVQTAAGDMVGVNVPASDTVAVQSAAATIQTDAQAIEADPGPSCIPGLRTNLVAAASDYSTSAIDATNALNQLSAGNADAATGDMGSATSAINNGNAKLAAATSAVQSYGASQGG